MTKLAYHLIVEMRKYDMSHYIIYDLERHNHDIEYYDIYITFKNYNEYTLFIAFFIVDMISFSIRSVRLNNIYIAIILEAEVLNYK